MIFSLIDKRDTGGRKETTDFTPRLNQIVSSTGTKRSRCCLCFLQDWLCSKAACDEWPLCLLICKPRTLSAPCQGWFWGWRRKKIEMCTYCVAQVRNWVQFPFRPYRKDVLKPQPPIPWLDFPAWLWRRVLGVHPLSRDTPLSPVDGLCLSGQPKGAFLVLPGKWRNSLNKKRGDHCSSFLSYIETDKFCSM